MIMPRFRQLHLNFHQRGPTPILPPAHTPPLTGGHSGLGREKGAKKEKEKGKGIAGYHWLSVEWTTEINATQKDKGSGSS